MNHITLSSKVTNKSLVLRDLSSPNTNTPRMQTGQESWSAKMLSRIKGIRIRSPFSPRDLSSLRTASSSSVPDIISSTKKFVQKFPCSSASMINIFATPNTNAQKKLDLEENRSLNVSEKTRGAHQTINLPNDILGDNTVNSLSLYSTPTTNTNRIMRDNKAFYIDENECTYVETVDSPRGMESEPVSMKRKISAEPFLSYTKQSPHLFWNDDLDESLPQEKTGDDSNNFLEYYTKNSMDWSLASFRDQEKMFEEESLKRKNSLQETDESDERISKPRCKDNLKEEGLKDSIDRDGEVCPTKTKIATEPFIPSTKKTVELSCNDDGHASFSTKRLDSLDLSDLSTVTFVSPCSSSTFCEDVDVDVPTSALKDSGFENNVSTLNSSP